MPFFHATVDHLAVFGFSKFLQNPADFTSLKTVPVHFSAVLQVCLCTHSVICKFGEQKVCRVFCKIYFEFSFIERFSCDNFFLFCLTYSYFCNLFFPSVQRFFQIVLIPNFVMFQFFSVKYVEVKLLNYLPPRSHLVLRIQSYSIYKQIRAQHFANPNSGPQNRVFS